MGILGPGLARGILVLGLWYSRVMGRYSRAWNRDVF